MHMSVEGVHALHDDGLVGVDVLVSGGIGPPLHVAAQEIVTLVEVSGGGGQIASGSWVFIHVCEVQLPPGRSHVAAISAESS